MDKLTPKAEGIDRRMLELHFNERRRRCRELGVKERKTKSVTPDRVHSLLSSNEVPVLMTSTKFFGESDDLPHSVVVGIDGEKVLVNNPLGHGKTPLPPTPLGELAGYKGDRCVVTIGEHGRVSG